MSATFGLPLPVLAGLRTTVADGSRRLGFDLRDRGTVLDLVALAMTRLAWRDGPLEDWHAEPFRRICDAEMMRANAANVRLVRTVLERHVPAAPTSVVLPRSVAGELLDEVRSALTNPSRRLPSGRTLAELAPERRQLGLFDVHVRWYADLWWQMLSSGADTGTSLGLFACYGARFCWKWWLAPAWPLLVEEFMRRLRDPQRWRIPMLVESVRALPTPSGVTPSQLRRTLLAGPDLLDAPAARYCLRGGLGAMLPQDLGLAGLPRWPVPPPYLRLIDLPPSC